VNETTQKAIERNYAHFHRVLASLLLELAELPGVVWLSDERHLIRGEGESNAYGKAIYPLEDLSPYQSRLLGLGEVQKQAAELSGNAPPGKGLLAPVVIEDVHHVRLRRHASHSSRVVLRQHAIARFETQLERTRIILKEDFKPHATMFDPKREGIEAEIVALEEGLARLRATDEETLRERYKISRVIPYVYLRSGEITRPYVRNVGLIVVGPSVRLVWADNVRRERSDKIRLEPLLVLGPTEVYSERAWQEASGKA
jgi:hypothetical protein